MPTAVTAEKGADAEMTITKDTKLKDLLSEYPWLKDELSGINNKFRMLNTPVGKILPGGADISEMSRKSGMDADAIIGKLGDLIEAHQ